MTDVTNDPIELLKAVPRNFADRTFLIDSATGRRLTFAECDREARLSGCALRSVGLSRGDRVVVVADNSLPLALLYFGALYAGVVVVPINPVSHPDEMDHVLRTCGAKHIVYTASHANLVRPDLQRAKGVAPLLLDELRGPEPIEPFTGSVPDDELIVIFTSGTASVPKGVSHSVRDIVQNGRLFGEMVGLTEENRFFNLLSLTYLGGYYNLLLLPYVNGSSVVLGQPFAPANLVESLATIQTHGVNTLWLVPSIMSMLIRLDRGTVGKDHFRANVRLCLCGTAPLPQDLRARFEERYGVSVFENYGLSETLFLSVNAPSDGPAPADVGRIVEGVQIRIASRNGGEVAPGEEGEILVRTPSLMRGYVTANGGFDLPDQGGFFPTGDVGRVQNGRLAITGRSKDLIIRGGVNVSPAAIETLIATHPAVKEVAVVGVSHPVMGEEVVAVIALEQGSDFQAVRLALADLCSRGLNRIKQPSSFVELQELPRTSNGKVQKAKLRAWLNAGGRLANGADAATPEFEFPSPARGDANESFLKPSKVVTDISEAMSIKYNTRVYEMKARGEDVIVLSLGEAFFDIPLFPFDDLPFPAIYHYSHSRGIPELRRRLAEYFASEYEVEFDPEREILITAGSKIAIYMALLSVLNPNDEVLIHDPAWVSYFEQVRLCYGIPVSVPYDVEVFGFERFITNRTKVIIINSPNNPRGRVYTLAELAHLNMLARKYNLYVLSDEAYSDFLLDPQRFISMGNLDTKRTHTIIVNSISKNFGISGWRLGYLITSAPLIDQMLKINQHLITCPATILEYYIAKHFTEIIAITKPQMRAVVERRERIAAYMSKIGLVPLAGDSTFYFFVGIAPSRLGSEDFCDRLLAKHAVCAVPGIGYGSSCDRYIRVGVGTESDERLMAGLDRIKALVQETSS